MRILGRDRSRDKRVNRPGRVVRLSVESETALKSQKTEGESFDATVRRLCGLPDKDGNKPIDLLWVLKSDAFETAEDARGAAVLRSVKLKTKLDCRLIRVRKL